jgi:hypothetical protein
MLIMAVTLKANFEQQAPADAKRRRPQAGRRHEGARPAESSSNGGQ